MSAEPVPWVETRHPPLAAQLERDRRLAQAKRGRPVVDVQLPERLVTVSTSDGDVLLSGEMFESLRDSMIGPSHAVDVGPDLRDASLELDDLADVAYELARVAAQVARPRTNLGSSGPPGRID